jgi:hypothetical protein
VTRQELVFAVLFALSIAATRCAAILRGGLTAGATKV